MTRANTAGRAAAFTLALLALVAAGAARAEVEGELVQQDGRRLSGTIRWLPASRKYVITAGGRKMEVPLAQVQQVRTRQPPANLQALARGVANGQYAQAVQPLQQIVDDYRMLQWDIVATRYLAEAYLGLGKAEDAVRKCEVIVRDQPEAAYMGDMAPVYWEALLQAGRDATLNRVLEDAVQKGNRLTAALAQIKRGDIERKRGNLKEALVDGYLRVVLLFSSVKEAQPEALYKALRCFEELGQSAYAEKMRRQLLQEYPQSEYADKLRAGA